jgi:hypothetical protein
MAVVVVAIALAPARPLATRALSTCAHAPHTPMRPQLPDRRLARVRFADPPHRGGAVRGAHHGIPLHTRVVTQPGGGGGGGPVWLGFGCDAAGPAGDVALAAVPWWTWVSGDVCGAAAVGCGGACACMRRLNASRSEPTAVRERACSADRKEGGGLLRRGACPGGTLDLVANARIGSRSAPARGRGERSLTQSRCVRDDRRRDWRAGAIEGRSGPCDAASGSHVSSLTRP